MSAESGVIQGNFPQGLHRVAAVLQAKGGPAAGTAPRTSRGVVSFEMPPRSLPLLGRGPGQPLPPALQARMESLLRADLSDVRVHAGPEIAGLGALALARGSHLYFAAGRYDPASPAGQRLIAHELTHVVQQRSGRVSNPFGRGLALVQDPLLEAEAERMAVRATVPVPAAAPAARAVQRSRLPRGGRVLQMRWDPVHNQPYEVWDQVIQGRRWYRQQTFGGFQYYSEPADTDYPIKIFLTPEHVWGGVPQILLPPPPQLMPPPQLIPSRQMPAPNFLMPPPKFPMGTNNNSGGFKTPSLPMGKSKPVLSLSGGPPMLSGQQTVLHAGPNDLVILARGCNSPEQFNGILQNQTAGGAFPNHNPTAPTDEQAISGVAFEGVPWKVSEERQSVRRRVDYTEYSTSSSVTQSFGSRGGVVIIRVSRKWITQGSGSENGWFINDDTPIKVIWSRAAQSETSKSEKTTNVKVNTTQSEMEEYRRNHPFDDDDNMNC